MSYFFVVLGFELPGFFYVISVHHKVFDILVGYLFHNLILISSILIPREMLQLFPFIIIWPNLNQYFIFSHLLLVSIISLSHLLPIGLQLLLSLLRIPDLHLCLLPLIDIILIHHIFLIINIPSAVLQLIMISLGLQLLINDLSPFGQLVAQILFQSPLLSLRLPNSKVFFLSSIKHSRFKIISDFLICQYFLLFCEFL